jgi:putative tryptophan/tyrosine transport system substrate-binding protein
LIAAFRYAASLPNGGDLTELDQLKRRSFITLLGGAAAWPLAARAQQGERMRRVGWVDFVFEDDPGGRTRVEVFQQGMAKLGWTLGRNLAIDYRWGIFDINKAQLAAAELLKLAPDVILCAGTPATLAFRQATSTVPIVFASVSEPVAQGFVQSLAHPGGNLTGFSYMEPTMGAKWLDLLKQIAPQVNHTALMFNPNSSPYSRLFYQSIETATTMLAVEATTAPVHNINEIEQAIIMLEGRPGGGLIVSPDGFTLANRKAIIGLTAKHSMPAVYGTSGAAFDGGLIHYNVDLVDQYQSAVAYVDHILRGGKRADLPVQQPTKFSLVINLRTAKALGLDVPPTLLARADEIIE